MSLHNEGPRAGSRAYLGLVKLHALGGKATIEEWMRAMSWAESAHTFHHEVAHKLIVRGKIFAVGAMHSITDDGLAHIGIELDAPPVESPVIVGPRYVAPMRPLSSKNIARLHMTREGALDYRDIPSRMGDSHIPHGTKAVA